MSTFAEDDPITYTIPVQWLGDMTPYATFGGYVRKVTSRYVYVDWDDPVEVARRGLSDRIDIKEAKERVQVHPFREKR